MKKQTSKIADVDVRHESIRAELAKIAEKYNGVLNPRQIVDAAADEFSPLHAEFVWDDGEAADMFRMAQAGALIRRVRYTVARVDGVTKKINLTTTRAYQSRPSMRNAEGGYEDVIDIVSDEQKRQEMLSQVLGELAAYRRRYESLIELRAVWAAIDEAAAASASSKKPHKPVRKNAPAGRGNAVAAR